jgi:RimJ/RimL family protein N-acetyltransferase
MRILETDRLIIKPVEEIDLDYLLKLRWDKQVMEWLIHEPLSRESQIKWYSGLDHTSCAFSIWLKRGNKLPDRYVDKLIGTIGLYDINYKHQRAKWNLRIDPEHWRQGLATEAIKPFLEYVFNTMNLNKLMGDCFAENIAEVNNLTKLGFKQEGVWKEHYFHKGKFRDSIQFVMLKSDYDTQRNSI